MKLVLLATLLAKAILAQTSVPSTLLPNNWAGFGAALNLASKPPVAGWYSYATLLSSKGQIYSFSTHDVLLSPQKPYRLLDSARTGAATVLRQFGPVTILGLGDIGMVASGASVGGAFSGGGLALVKLGKTNWDIVVGARVIKTSGNGNQDIYEIGLGRSWK